MQPFWTLEGLYAGVARHPEAWAAVRDGQSFVPLLAFLERASEPCLKLARSGRRAALGGMSGLQGMRTSRHDLIQVSS